MMAPQAQHREPTCVGMCPPRVGLPITKPPEPTTAFTASSVLSTSRLMVSTPTPALVMPLLIACRTVGEALELHPLQLFSQFADLLRLHRVWGWGPPCAL